MTIHAVTMPKWGIEMTEGTLAQWSVREGQQVNKGDPLLEVETEKIVNTVESPAAGTLRRIIATAGEVQPVGALIAVLADTEVSDADVASFIDEFKGATVSFEPDSGQSVHETTAAPTDSPAAALNDMRAMAQRASPGTDASGAPEGLASDVRISPIARRVAESLGVDISKVQGTGRNGRISREDVEAYAARAGISRGSGAGSSSEDRAADPGVVRADNPSMRVKMSSTRATIARRLLESKQTIPHYRLTVDVDVGRLQLRRRELMKQSGTKITLNDMLVRATALALTRHPALNAQLDGDEIVQYTHADIAIAVATANGLMAPIVRSADLKALPDIARTTADLTERAKRGALQRAEISGGTFTISNLGMFGLNSFDAIINPPQVAILAVGSAQERIVARNGSPVVAQMMTLTLSADHRVVDGALAAAFLATLAALVQEDL